MTVVNDNSTVNSNMPTKDTVEVDKVDKAGALNNTVEEN